MSTQASSTMADSDAEQLTMLRESAMDVVQRGANMKHLRERRGTLPGYDPAYLRQMAELGWVTIQSTTNRRWVNFHTPPRRSYLSR